MSRLAQLKQIDFTGTAADVVRGDGSIGVVPAHASRHKDGGADPIKLDELAQPDDNTTLNATTLRHGLLRKLSGVATEFLDGSGNWTTPSGAARYEDSIPGEEVTTDDLLQGGADILSAIPNLASFKLFAREGAGSSAKVLLKRGVHYQLEGAGASLNRKIRWLGATSTVPLEATDELYASYRGV